MKKLIKDNYIAILYENKKIKQRVLYIFSDCVLYHNRADLLLDYERIIVKYYIGKHNAY